MDAAAPCRGGGPAGYPEALSPTRWPLAWSRVHHPARRETSPPFRPHGGSGCAAAQATGAGDRAGARPRGSRAFSGARLDPRACDPNEVGQALGFGRDNLAARARDPVILPALAFIDGTSRPLVDLFDPPAIAEVFERAVEHGGPQTDSTSAERQHVTRDGLPVTVVGREGDQDVIPGRFQHGFGAAC